MKDPKRGRISFFFVIIYLICEYMRPQQMYSSLSGIPLAKIAIACIVIASLLEGLRFNNFNFQNVFLLLFLLLIFLSCMFAVNQELAWPVFFDFIKWAVIYFL
ncbi:MAG TPA: hypothetical protein VEJ88_05485, partial [Dissulfurispiraceae bacterium]|nr:hypothetical protein [Dissulfurispiraceae bacterium]